MMARNMGLCYRDGDENDEKHKDCPEDKEAVREL